MAKCSIHTADVLCGDDGSLFHIARRNEGGGGLTKDGLAKLIT